MNARPAIMSGHNPQLILDGIKTETRRVAKWRGCAGKNEAIPSHVTRDVLEANVIRQYGEVGDLLWVREHGRILGHWRQDGETQKGRKRWRFVIDAKEARYGRIDPAERNGMLDKERVGFWSRPAIHMPMWSSRITLELTEVRLEHLQDMTEKCAEAEGMRAGRCEDARRQLTALEHYRALWDNLHPKYTLYGGSSGQRWADNPWVWVLGFKAHVSNVSDFIRERAKKSA